MDPSIEEVLPATGDVALPDGRMLIQELVRAGFYWWYRKYEPGDIALPSPLIDHAILNT